MKNTHITRRYLSLSSMTENAFILKKL